ncbi:MAG: acyl-CoA dehydrogenase family protein [Elusimicrobia bacterium]|nr:acyl-CoA dehydrogenase family protein [Elusimicrobiota bacterium]
MDFKLKPEHLEIQRKTREFCEREVMPVAAKYDKEEAFPWELIDGLRKLGLLGIIFPKEYGGIGLDTVSFCLVLEELGRADAALALTVESHNGLCSNHIYLAGSEEQKKKYLPRLATGECLGAWALTEPAAGSDAASIQTTAAFDGKHWVLNGSKTFTTQGSVAGIYVIMARTPELANGGGTNITAFVCEKGAPGLEIGKKEIKMGLHASDTAQLHLNNLKLPPEQVIGKPWKAFRDVMRVLDGGRVGISGISIGIARASLEEGIKWVKPRKAEFDIRPDLPGLSGAGKILADLATEIEAARLLMLHAATLLDNGEKYSKEASMAKLMSGELAVKAPTMVLDLFGPYGASLDCNVQRYFRDSKLYTIGEGSSQIQELIISRHLLAD